MRDLLSEVLAVWQAASVALERFSEAAFLFCALLTATVGLCYDKAVGDLSLSLA